MSSGTATTLKGVRSRLTADGSLCSCLASIRTPALPVVRLTFYRIALTLSFVLTS